MFNDDVSAIPTVGCTVLTGSGSISNYYGSTKKDFVFNGGKWYLYRTQTSNYGNYDVSSYNCLDLSSGINSNAQYVPFFYGMVFILFAASIILFAWSVRGILGRF